MSDTKFLILCTAIVVAIIVGLQLHAVAVRPRPPEVCHETAQVVFSGTEAECPAGATLLLEPLQVTSIESPKWMARCKCSAEQADAGK